MTLGEKILNRRTALELSQGELADLVEVNSAKVISNWEKDINKPDVEKLSKLCQVLKCPASYFVDSEEDSSINEEEMQIIQGLRELDEFGKEVVLSNLEIQLQRCRNTEIKLNQEIVLTTEPIRERVILTKRDTDYEAMKDLLPKLKRLKKKSYLQCDTIHTFLAYRGYNRLISIADLMLIFNGLKVPSKRLYDDLVKILELSLTL